VAPVPSHHEDVALGLAPAERDPRTVRRVGREPVVVGVDRELVLVGAIDAHGEDLEVAVAIADEDDPLAVGAVGGVVVAEMRSSREWVQRYAHPRGPASIVGLAILVVAVAYLGSNAAQATFPGHNGRIVFERPARLHKPFNLYSMRPDGTHRRLITRFGNGPYYPSVDPAGRRVAFSASKGGLSDIFTISLKGNNRRQITDTPDASTMPAFSGPLGKRIAWAERTALRSNIWVALRDGSHHLQLTDARRRVDNLDPAFSPDGDQIAFDRARGEQGAEIFIMRSDGSDKRRRLTDSPPGFESFTPCFSPGGGRIVFSRAPTSGGGGDIFIMRKDGSRVRQLTDGAGEDAWPCFSPNGRRIAFTRQPFAGESEIMVMRRDGSHVHQVTHTPKIDDDTFDWAAK
jgi:Tol biopolymer transport system component